MTKDTTLLTWIRNIDKRSKYTTSVCTGAWLLAATGLLKNQQATTHWYGKSLLKDEFGIISQNKRYVKSGKYWTSAGVSAGIDMSLAVIKDIMGEKYTQMVMLDLEYDPQPPVKGGRTDNTDPFVVKDMKEMYDGGMEAVLHPQSMKTGYAIDNKADPVCQMAVASSVRDTVHYKGNIYGFCSGSFQV